MLVMIITLQIKDKIKYTKDNKEFGFGDYKLRYYQELKSFIS